MKKKALKKRLKEEKRINKYLQENIAILSKELREQKQVLRRAKEMMVDSGRDIADGMNETAYLKEVLQNCQERFMELSMENDALKRELRQYYRGSA